MISLPPPFIPFISSSLPLLSFESSISLELSLSFALPFIFVDGMNCGLTGPVNESSEGPLMGPAGAGR